MEKPICQAGFETDNHLLFSVFREVQLCAPSADSLIAPIPARWRTDRFQSCSARLSQVPSQDLWRGEPSLYHEVFPDIPGVRGINWLDDL